MEDKLLLIDGHSILNRAFYGLPDLTNGKGQHTNAVYGFLTILFRILREEQPVYLIVAFDRSEPTFRHEIYAEYKGTRKGMPEELREQVPLMKEVLKAMGVTIVEKAGLEADDIIGTLSRKAIAQKLKVTIISGDRDLLQLATDSVLIRIPKTKKTGTEIEDYYADQVKKTYGVTPEEFIDIKALMGDASDNIPGVPGIGEKTAQKLIETYHSIENAYEQVESIEPKRAREALKNYFDMAQLSKTLATINLNAPLTVELTDAKIGNLYTEEAYVLFRELEFKNLLDRFEKDHSAVTQELQVDKILDVKKLIAIDNSSAVGIATGRNGKGELLAALAVGDDSVKLIEATSITESELKEELVRICKGVEKLCVLDLKELLKEIEVDQKQIMDCHLAAYLINPLKSSYRYEELAQEYCGIIYPSEKELDDKAMELCYQAKAAQLLSEPLIRQLEEASMMTLYEQLELPLVFVLHRMEKVGIRVQGQELAHYGDMLADRIEGLTEDIFKEAGCQFNLNSPKQLGEVLFEKLKLPYGKKTKTGYSTAADVLEKLAIEYPVVNQILEYRQLAKLKSTYAEGLGNCIGSDGRIHSTFNQTITATGRISSTEPNLQNIPVRMELGRMIRKVFVPEDGYVFVDADYSQIELRVLAHMSGDEKLIHAYSQAEDIHSLTASQVFHVPLNEVTPLQRRNAKAVNFGIVYGISSFGLSQDLSISRKEAGEYIERYFETYPGIKSFLDQLVADAKENGYVTSLFHRRRPIPELSSTNFMQRSFGERIAMNSPIQGTAADIIKMAMVRVDTRLKEEKLDARMVLQVHDELLIEVREDQAKQVAQLLEEEMTGAAKLLVRLDVDVHTGRSWYEAK